MIDDDQHLTSSANFVWSRTMIAASHYKCFARLRAVSAGLRPSMRPASLTRGGEPQTIKDRDRWSSAETFDPMTLDHIRSHGCHDLLIYSDSGRCHHSATLSADHLPVNLPVRSLYAGGWYAHDADTSAPTCGRTGRRTSTNGTSSSRARYARSNGQASRLKPNERTYQITI